MIVTLSPRDMQSETLPGPSLRGRGVINSAGMSLGRKSSRNLLRLHRTASRSGATRFRGNGGENVAKSHPHSVVWGAWGVAVDFCDCSGSTDARVGFHLRPRGNSGAVNMMRAIRVLVACLGIGLFAAQAQAVVITPAAFTGGEIVESFEGLVPGPNNSLSLGYFSPGIVGPFPFASGAILSAPIPNPGLGIGAIVGDFSVGSAGFGLLGNGSVSSAVDVPTGSAYLGLDDPSTSGPIEFMFATPQTRVGAYVTGVPGLVTMSVFDAMGMFLETTTVGTVAVGGWPTNFIGLERAEGIGFVAFNADFLVLDDLTFEVGTAAIPEPTSLALLGMSAAGFCGVRLRRRRREDTEQTA